MIKESWEAQDGVLLKVQYGDGFIDDDITQELKPVEITHFDGQKSLMFLIDGLEVFTKSKDDRLIYKAVNLT